MFEPTAREASLIDFVSGNVFGRVDTAIGQELRELAAENRLLRSQLDRAVASLHRLEMRFQAMAVAVQEPRSIPMHDESGFYAHYPTPGATAAQRAQMGSHARQPESPLGSIPPSSNQYKQVLESNSAHSNHRAPLEPTADLRGSASVVPEESSIIRLRDMAKLVREFRRVFKSVLLKALIRGILEKIPAQDSSIVFSPRKTASKYWSSDEEVALLCSALLHPLMTREVVVDVTRVTFGAWPAFGTSMVDHAVAELEQICAAATEIRELGYGPSIVQTPGILA